MPRMIEAQKGIATRAATPLPPSAPAGAEGATCTK